MKTKLRFWLTVISLSVLAIANPAYAQRVSAELNGQVVDANGNSVSGATVEIVHVPSGTTRVAQTQDNGRYTARGLRVGGPYTVTASADGYRSNSQEGITLNLGDPEFVSVTIVSDATDLDTLQVVGAAQSTVFQPDNMGAATEVTREQIEDLPSITRSLNDYIRLDPRAVVIDKARQEISVGGGSDRFNSYTIDGVSTNDEFGLNASGQPAARGQPLSLEWLEQINIDSSPYAPNQGGFTGAGVSAVTKSGTNDFNVRLYGTFRNEDLVGEDENGNDFNVFDDNWYGAYVSGPIVKDKLFFFVGYEEQDQTDATTAILPQSAPSNVIILSDIGDVVGAAQNIYGFNPGNTEILDELSQGDEKVIAKIDWNISNNHRASFRYSNVDATQQRVGRSNFDFDLSTRFYANTSELDQFTAQLFSNWNANVSTEFRIARADYHSEPTFDARLPEVEIRDFLTYFADSNGNGIQDANEPTESGFQDVRFGTERFRHLNQLDTTTDDIFFNLNYFTGDHSIDAGISLKEVDVNNAFVFDNLGSWQFDSLDDFIAGNEPRNYSLRVASNPSDPDSVRAIWSWEVLSAWIGDTWQLSPNLTFLLGARYDQFSTDDLPLQNNLFEQSFGFSNQGTLDGEGVFQPRFGFNYLFNTPYDMQLRGGIGLFAGRQPGVWLSNPYTNPGGTVQVFTCQRSGCTDLDPNFRFNADPDQQPRVGGLTGARQDVDVVEDGFRLPTDLKMNLAIDVELPFWEGSTFTAEVIHTEVKDGIFYQHLNLGDPTGTLPDGRNAYWGDIATGSTRRANADSAFNDVLLLRNTGGGDRTTATFALRKNWQFENGSTMFAQGSATFVDSSDVNSGTSSRAISNWNNWAVVNPNDEVVSSSNFEIDESYKFIWSYRANWFDFGRTKFSAFYQYRSGRPYSWTFDNDANGDGISDNDLLYVPRGPDDVIFADPAEAAAFFEFVESVPALASAKGGIVGRNTERSPRVSQMDVKIAQEFSIGDRFNGEIFLNIENFLNLLNDEWGEIDQVPFEFVAEIVDFEGVDPATGKYIYSFNDAGRDLSSFFSRQDGQGQSRWAAQIGIRLDF